MIPSNGAPSASLLYLLMTLGPPILSLSSLDRDLGKWAKPVIVFGRVPLFYYLLHLPLLHALAVLLSYIRYGHGHGIWYGPALDPESAALFPKDYGYGLLAVYAVWLLVILILYPLCRWFAELKTTAPRPVAKLLVIRRAASSFSKRTCPP